MAFPVIVPGCAGAALTVTLTVWADELPQLLLALTLTKPLEVLALAVMLLVVLLPDHPLGSTQVYPVAPPTAAML